ncbi:GNAT family N-acetyltransferase [Actinoplanes sp. NPDC051411]|uniref:GNAT family N-acetyltransferase n=1 Tax=Actinoplanes sp. NPDC051411 TaxID=3155522 RepID=UPI0034464816
MDELLTDRLLLRAFRPGDLPAVHAYASDADVVRFMDWGPNTVEETRYHVNRSVAMAEVSPRLTFPYAVERLADRRVIGAAELSMTSLDHRRAEMGYVFAREAWGQGYATEAAGALLGYAFDKLDLHRVAATCDPDNTGSARVLRKIGMAPEGRMRAYFLIRGEWRDRLMFAAVRS